MNGDYCEYRVLRHDVGSGWVDSPDSPSSRLRVHSLIQNGVVKPFPLPLHPLPLIGQMSVITGDTGSSNIKYCRNKRLKNIGKMMEGHFFFFVC